MNSNTDICDMKEDIMNTVTRVIAEVIVINIYSLKYFLETTNTSGLRQMIIV